MISKILNIFMAAVLSISSGFAVESERAFPVLAPYNKQYVQILWSSAEYENAGVPIVFGDSVLFPCSHSVNRLAERDGSILGTVDFDEKVSESCRGAVIGETLIQPTRTSLYTINLNDMTVTDSRTFGEIITNVGVLDNCAYFGVKTDSRYKVICADLENELETLWEYESEALLTSPALLDGHVIFGSGDNLAVFDGNSNPVEIPAGAEITSVFAGEYAVFMSCADGNLRKLRLDENGEPEEDSLLTCELGGELTAPVEYNNRVYVGSSEGFFVLDGLNMEIEKAFTEMKNSAEPVICYGGGQRAYTAAPHSDPNGSRWYLYSVLDGDDGISASEVAKIIDFTDGKIAVSQSGVMYFRDARGQLWSLAVSNTNVFMMVLKIVLTLATIVMIIVILRAWVKRRAAKRPPEY